MRDELNTECLCPIVYVVDEYAVPFLSVGFSYWIYSLLIHLDSSCAFIFEKMVSVLGPSTVLS